MFAPLYSSKPNSRPSTPTYFVLGALVLKDLFGLTDEELEDRIAFSLDFQYALGTVSLDHQPINQRTLNRFRAANSLYTRE
ncbi:transposase, partial [Erysipelotrichaceae bacterium RD49]|nr:transposase [Erysipelotrichaceae bacterium RD49]